MKYIEEVSRELRKYQTDSVSNMPSKVLVGKFVDECVNILFPVDDKRIECSGESISTLLHIKYYLKVLLMPIEQELKEGKVEICKTYIKEFPDIYKKLMLDAVAFRDFDPATNSLGEVIISYPGFYAICVYRLAHILYKMGIPIIPRMMSEYAHSKTGIDINAGAVIGDSFFIDHGTGVVIGETTIIKNNVKIYQGVTLGALQVKKSLANVKRHPTVEDNVIIYAGATILGGDTVVGKDSIIGGNVWITSSILPKSIVYHTNKTRVRTNFDPTNIIDFQI